MITAAAHEHWLSRGVTVQGESYEHDFAIRGEKFEWCAQMGKPDHSFFVDTRIVDCRTPFLQATTQSSGPQLWRSRRVDTASPHPVAFLLIPTRGAIRINHVDREAEIKPGSYAVCLSNEPITADYIDRSQVLLAFLTDLELIQDRRLTARIGKAADLTGVGSLLFRHLRETLQIAPELDASALAAAGNAVGELLTATLFTGSPLHQPDDNTMLERLKLFIEQNLRDPGLSVQRVAAEHHISLRTAYRLFERDGDGIAAYIRARRMARCRSDIVERPDLTLAAICRRWGVPDSKHFARQYHAVYGERPIDTRRLAQEG
jgi:AraC-like DNA-binding protein